MGTFLAVEAPDIAPATGGLLSVANVVDGDRRVGFGVAYSNEGLCGLPKDLPAGCFNDGPVAGNPAKSFDGFADVTAPSFGIYKGVECWLDGSNDYTATATKALQLGESYAVAKALATKVLDVSPTIILPATNDPVVAFAAAEQWAGVNYSGQAVIHVTRYGATILASLGLLVRNLDGSLETWLGTKVSADAGYTSGETTTFNIWVTGQVNLWRTPIIVNSAPNTNLNKGRAIAERLYSATVDCMRGKVVATATTLTNKA